MSEGSYTGYLFAFSTDDLDPTDGLRKTRILAVSRSVDEAMERVRELAPGQAVELIEVGADVLAEARMAGIEDDGAKVVARVDGLE